MDYSITNHIHPDQRIVDGVKIMMKHQGIASICMYFEVGETLDDFNEKEIKKIVKSVQKLSKHNNAKYAARLERVPWAKKDKS